MSQVDEVRAASEIVKVVGDYVKLRKAGANMMGLCPFHQEKTPSFAVHPGKQIFHCFGCGVGGDVFKFIMLIENMSFPEALRRLAEKAGIALRESAGDETYDANTRERAVLHEIHELAAKFYAAQLGGTAEGRAAQAYLSDRGLTDEVVAHFRLGYAPAEGKALTKRLTDVGIAPELAEKSGLVLRDAEGNRRFDRFRRRIIFPIQSDTGKVVGFGARALGDDQPKYLNSPETPIYTKSRVLYHLNRAGNDIRKLDYAILVEGYMDCIAVASCGIENVVASCGTSLTESQIRLLSRYSKRVVVNYDPDSAGVKATERSLDLLLEAGFEAKVLALPGGMDPDSFIRKQGAESYRKRLSKVRAYIDFLIDRAVAQHDTSTADGKAAAANQVLPHILRVPGLMAPQAWANHLIERLKIYEPTMQSQLMHQVGVRRIEGFRQLKSVEATQAEKRLLRAILGSQDIMDEFLPRLCASEDIRGLITEDIFKRLSGVGKVGDNLDVAQLEEGLTPDQKLLLHEAMLTREQVDSHEELIASLSSLRRRRLERERDRLQAEIRAAEQEKDGSRLAKLLAEKASLAKELAQLRGA